MLVRTRIASTGSPWLSKCEVGEQFTVAISHGEGRFVAPQEVLDTLMKNGQIATQYVDIEGNPTMDQSYNPNGSVLAIEGITSPDGRVFGKMGHSERSGEYLYKNVTGDKMCIRDSPQGGRQGSLSEGAVAAGDWGSSIIGEFDMEKINLNEYLASNEYPGRGIAVAMAPDGRQMFIGYFIMGRSENSRNRVFDPCLLYTS